jgi:hypothetical protein
MATKKKGKKTKKSSRSAARKITRKVRSAKRSPKKEAARNPVVKKKMAAKSRKTAVRAKKKPARKGRQGATFEQPRLDSRSGALTGDLQGLRDRESADSESVDELLEEGNAFEAGVVTGVEEAEDEPEREVHTHEVPEDDVPEEYREED